MIVRQRPWHAIRSVQGSSKPSASLVRCLACSAAQSTRVTRSRQPVKGAQRRHPAQHSRDQPIPGSDIWNLSAAEHNHNNSSSSSSVDKRAADERVSSSSPPPQQRQDHGAVQQTTFTDIEGNLPPASRLPVNVPHDELGILDNAKGLWADKLRNLLSNPAIVVSRELEMLNVLVGYEQANKYRIESAQGQLLGYLVEEDLGFGRAIARQACKTHRAFKATVIDPEGHVILIIRRPFSWINSRIYACTPSERDPNEPDSVLGEAQQEWHLYRRKYNQFVSRNDQGNGPEMVQFGVVDEGFLAWDFTCRNEKGEPIASISRNFSGLARELFTDTGAYVCRFEAVADQVAAELASPSSENALLLAPSSVPSTQQQPHTPTMTTATSEPLTKESSEEKGLTTLPSIPYDHRAVLLATAISCDFDYFSRDRGGGMMGGWGAPMIFPFPMGGTGGGGGASTEGVEGTGAEVERGLPRDDDVYGGEDRGGGWGQSSPAEDHGAEQVPGQWNNDEVMQDPWSNPQDQQEQGGTWGWGDLFPGEGQDGGDEGSGGDW
ncbi:hypothetical protein ACM66B_001318 [Microbotryomycetes sp. NB124-2]